jgi:hypothetical protein
MDDFHSYRLQGEEAMALEEAGLFRGPASAIGWCPGSSSQASEETKAARHGTDRDAMRCEYLPLCLRWLCWQRSTALQTDLSAREVISLCAHTYIQIRAGIHVMALPFEYR